MSNALCDGIPHGGTANVTGAGALTQPLSITYTRRIRNGVWPVPYGAKRQPVTTRRLRRSRGFESLGSSDAKTYSIASWTENGFFAPIDMSPASSDHLEHREGWIDRSGEVRNFRGSRREDESNN